VRFNPLDEETIVQLLLQTGATTDSNFAGRVAALSHGSLERARQLSDPALWEFRDQLLAALASPRLESVRLARAVQAFVDEAGKDARPKRARLRMVIEFALDFDRARIRAAETSLSSATASLGRPHGAGAH
jgi:DNA polymerase-3 subunit delta'